MPSRYARCTGVAPIGIRSAERSGISKIPIGCRASTPHLQHITSGGRTKVMKRVEHGPTTHQLPRHIRSIHGIPHVHDSPWVQPCQSAKSCEVRVLAGQRELHRDTGEQSSYTANTGPHPLEQRSTPRARFDCSRARRTARARPWICLHQPRRGSTSRASLFFRIKCAAAAQCADKCRQL
jgi:hypothetical protein